MRARRLLQALAAGFLIGLFGDGWDSLNATPRQLAAIALARLVPTMLIYGAAYALWPTFLGGAAAMAAGSAWCSLLTPVRWNVEP